MKHEIVKTLVLITSGVLLLITGNSLADDYRPAMLANPCAGCHGTDGNSPGPMPSLKGLSNNDIVSAMKAFKADQRKGTVMNRIAKGYTDEEIELIAKHFAATR